ncbi:MAG: hypothetical protein R3D98_13095 [Candidatus Krumholzibacteriia bacterium]
MRGIFCILGLGVLGGVAWGGELAAVGFAGEWPVVAVEGDAPQEVVIVGDRRWTFDCGDDAELLVGRIVSAVGDGDGRVYLLDGPLGRVIILDDAGQVERVVGRVGEGPGEFHGVWRAVVFDDGRLGVAGGCASPGFDFSADGTLVLLDEVGDPAGRWLLSAEAGGAPVGMVRDLRHAGGPVLAVTHRGELSPPDWMNIFELSLVDPATGERSVLARTILTENLRARSVERELFEVFAHGRCDIDADGRVAAALERDRWSVGIREPDGSGVVIRRSLVPRLRTAAEKAAILADLRVTEDHYLLADHDPVVGRVRWRPDGCLWVEPLSIEPRPGCLACFDELAPDGTLRRRVHLQFDQASLAADLVFLADGRLILLDPSRPAVSLYRLPPPSCPPPPSMSPPSHEDAWPSRPGSDEAQRNRSDKRPSGAPR